MRWTRQTLLVPVMLVGFWCVLLVGIYHWSLSGEERHARELALLQTRTLFAQIVSTRAWNAAHGGVLVPRGSAEPNPYLPEGRQVVLTADGQQYIRINPAAMTRQISELLETSWGASFHITSLDPLRPSNAADAWEVEALNTFARGNLPEMFALDAADGTPRFRFMAPLRTETTCLPCHSKPGDVVGSLRGGISVSLDAGPLLAASADRQRDQGWAFGIVGLVGLVGIGGATLQISRRQALAEQANSMKSAFLANMSHDMRTPLTGIMGMVELLEADIASTSRARMCLQRLKAAAGNLLEIVTDITDFSCLDSGRVRLAPRAFGLRQALADCLRLYRYGCEAKGITLDLMVDDNVPDHLFADDFRLRQALGNLVGNGVKFTESGGITVHVRRETDAPHNSETVALAFAVQDTGVGIRPDERERIFESFVQGDAAGRLRCGGTGLGLAISREIALMLGGDITVSSEAGKGSLFVLTARFGVLAGDAPQAVALPARGRTWQPYRVLVAEDNAVTSLYLREVLEQAGHTVTVVGDGAAALDALQRAPADVALLDVRMPGMDGIEAAARLRSGAVPGISPALPVVILTASAVGEERHRLQQLDITGCLVKPLGAATLLAAVDAAASGGAFPLEGRCCGGQAVDVAEDTTSVCDDAATVQAGNGEEALPMTQYDATAALADVGGNVTLLRMLVQAFLDDAPARLAALVASMQHGQTQDMLLAAHALKNGAGTLHLELLRARCAQLEDTARAGTLDAPLAQEVVSMLKDVTSCLEAWRAGEM